MSFNLNSPKSSNIPIIHGSKYSPSIDKTSQSHRSAFHLSNLLQTLTKFRRNIRTTNSFVRSTSSNHNDSQTKSARRSFTKADALTNSITRPSSCFILLSPSKKETENCLFFQKSTNSTIFSPKCNGISSFSKLKRVSSFLLPLKRKQSLALNHSLYERPFKAKENNKRRSRLLHSTVIKTKYSASNLSSIKNGSFGYQTHPIQFHSIDRDSIRFDLISIDLMLQIRLNSVLYNNYRPISSDNPPCSWINIFKPFYGILIERKTLIFFQPKLMDGVLQEKFDFIYLPFQSMKYEENKSSTMAYDPSDPNSIQIPLHWISKNYLNEYYLSTEFISHPRNGHKLISMHDNHPLFGNASLISEALRHYQRLENETHRERICEKSTRKSDKHYRRHYHIKESQIRPILVQQAITHKIKPTSHHFDPIHLRRKQCSSTLIDEEIPMSSVRHLNCLSASSSSSSGFRSHSRSSSIQTSSLAGSIGHREISLYADVVPIESTKLTHHMADEIIISRQVTDQMKFSSEDSKRANVIKEIYKTEHDYLGHLRNLVEGYLKKMRLRTDLFTEKQIELLMGNIEEIHHFQQAFFQLLKLSINEQNLHESLIGKCFLLYKEEFKKYSDYCINHPLSCLELTKLESNVTYQNFFETCRLQANMIELKLDGFLLSPIQRICQYPLQLNELLKYTNVEHKDYENIQQALHAMRDVACFINERKRRMEYVEIIHKWQLTVEQWQGKNLIETSTQGLGRADAYLYQNGKKEQVTLFLFDHILIICKKDRRNALIYFGRADLDNSQFEDLIDGKVSRLDEENLVHLLFAWRLYDRLQNKTYLFAHRSPADKLQMIDALEYERAYVQENLSKGLEIPLYTRLATLKTQQYLAEQPTPMSRSTTATSFPFITKPNRSISAILRTSNTQCNHQSIISTITTSIDHPPLSRRRFVPSRKSSLPRFVRSSSRDSSIDESLRSTKSRFRFWS